MLTPAGRDSRIRASTTRGLGSRMSTMRLCVRISNCSRESLSMNGLRMTVSLLISVGSGIGPAVRAFVRRAVSTILSAAWSSTRWSYALSRIRIFCATASPFPFLYLCDLCDLWLLDDLGHHARADGLATFADGEPESLLHTDRLTQRDLHDHVVAGHRHLHAVRQLDLAGDVGRPHVELRAIPG